jgi:hypothetical protein
MLISNEACGIYNVKAKNGDQKLHTGKVMPKECKKE